MNIIIALDKAYIQHATVTLFSLLKNNEGHRFKFFLITEENNSEHFHPISDLISQSGNTLEIKHISPHQFGDVKVDLHISLATYYRLLIPSIIQNESKALYIDCDLVIDDSIAPLYEINLEDNYVAAVRSPGFDQFEKIGMTNSNYFNAGVLLINLKQWREADITQNMLEYARDKKDDIINWDQDVLNYFFQGKWKELPYKWNFQSYFLNKGIRNQYTEKPAIIHFTSSIKPWDFMSVHPWRQHYYKYLKQTKFKNWRPKPENLWHLTKRIILRLINYYPKF